MIHYSYYDNHVDCEEVTIMITLLTIPTKDLCLPSLPWPPRTPSQELDFSSESLKLELQSNLEHKLCNWKAEPGWAPVDPATGSLSFSRPRVMKQFRVETV